MAVLMVQMKVVYWVPLKDMTTAEMKEILRVLPKDYGSVYPLAVQ